jgi:hypothetical protein
LSGEDSGREFPDLWILALTILAFAPVGQEDLRSRRGRGKDRLEKREVDDVFP